MVKLSAILVVLSMLCIWGVVAVSGSQKLWLVFSLAWLAVVFVVNAGLVAFLGLTRPYGEGG